jgi:hypothetical protein
MKATTAVLSGFVILTTMEFGALAEADVGKKVLDWLVPARLRGQPEAPRLIGTSTEGKTTIVYISMSNGGLLTFQCTQLDKGGTLCMIPGRNDMTVELP